MKTGIIVCGCNGSGKSTLGKALFAALQYNFIDIEDCYFPKDSKDYTYEHARTFEEAKQVLIEAVNKHDNFVLVLPLKGITGMKYTHYIDVLY